jgi:histidine ammonia-lyase
MATGAALRLHDMAENLAAILSIELLAAAQGFEFHRPLQSAAGLETAHGLVRGAAAAWDADRAMAPDIAAVKALVERGRFAALVDLG